MKVALIYNMDMTGVINIFGMQNKEIYNPQTIKKIASALESGGHNVSIIDGNMNVIENLQSFMPKVVDGERIGMVFNLAYGIQGESRYTHIPAMLEMLGIPYVGSSPMGHTIALDKVITKIIMQKNDIPTPEFWVFSSEKEDMSNVKFPAIVKPKMESVSFGLKIVNNKDELKEAVTFVIREFKQQALVEKFIAGREFAVGLLGNDPIEIFPVLEFDLGGDPNAIQSIDDKKTKPRKKICPAKISDVMAKEMQQLSLMAFKALQLRDFARVDIRLDSNNNIWLLEINSMASLGLTGSYVYAAEIFGYNYVSLVNKMLDVAVIRYFSKKLGLDESPKTGEKKAMSGKIRSYLRTRQDNSEEILKRLIDTNTYYQNVEGINQTGQYLKKIFGSLNFGYEVVPQVDLGNILFFTNNSDSKYDILFLTNIDNDIKINKQAYFQVSGQKIIGSGAWENKGGIVVLVMAMHALKYLRLLRKAKIGILVTSDNSLQGRFAKSIIKQKSTTAKYVFGMHGAFLNGGIVTSRSGAAVYKYNMNLKKTDDARNVVTALSIFLKSVSSIVNLSNVTEGLLIAPGELNSHTNLTEPFANAEMKLSVRYNHPEQFEKTDNKLRKIVSTGNKAITDSQFEGGERRPPMLYSEKNKSLWEIISRVANKLDISVKSGHRWSSADIAFADQSKSLVDGLGPVGAKMPGSSEFILRHSLIERATLLALLIYEISIKNKH